MFNFLKPSQPNTDDKSCSDKIDMRIDTSNMSADQITSEINRRLDEHAIIEGNDYASAGNK